MLSLQKLSNKALCYGPFRRWCLNFVSGLSVERLELRYKHTKMLSHFVGISCSGDGVRVHGVGVPDTAVLQPWRHLSRVEPGVWQTLSVCLSASLFVCLSISASLSLFLSVSLATESEYTGLMCRIPQCCSHGVIYLESNLEPDRLSLSVYLSLSL